MDRNTKIELLKQLIWDYNIPAEEIEAVLDGRMSQSGHYTRAMLFRKVIETYPWFTVIQLIKPEEIKTLLTDDIINKLRAPSLRKKYEFISRRLHEVIPDAG
jgi:hypothetical protein